MSIFSKLKEKVPSDFSTVTIFGLFAKALQAILTIIVIRVLSIDDYATFTMFLTISSTILGIAGQSFSLAYVRYNTEKISLDANAKDSVFALSQVVNLVTCVLVGAIVAVCGESLGYASYILLLSVLYGFILGAIQMNMAFLQSRERYAASGIVENCKQAAILAFVLLAIVCFGATLDSIVISYVLSGVFCFAVSLGYFIEPIRKGKVSFFIHRPEAKQFISASIWLILYSAVMQTFNQVDVSMLSAMGDKAQVAEYGVALKYYNIILILLPSIKTVLRVRMSKNEMTSDVMRQKTFSIKWIKKTLMPFLIVTIAVCIAAQFLFPILNGTEYNSAIIVFDVLCVCAFFAYLLAPGVSLVMSLSRYKEQFLFALIAFLLNASGNFFLIPFFGATGVAISTTVSQVFLNTAMVALVFYHAKKNELSK